MSEYKECPCGCGRHDGAFCENRELQKIIDKYTEKPECDLCGDENCLDNPVSRAVISRKGMGHVKNVCAKCRDELKGNWTDFKVVGQMCLVTNSCIDEEM